MNILYLLCHPTLTDFEVPILIRKGYGVLIVKKNSFRNVPSSLGETVHEQYDNFIHIDPFEIIVLNQVKWYDNQVVEPHIMSILNKHFKYIFITLLTTGKLLEQLIAHFYGQLVYRFFGRESERTYFPLIKDYLSPKVKYIFSYQSVYDFEKHHSNIYNDKNSLVIPLGLPNMFITKYINTYTPLYNRLCFICSKIGSNPYYTTVYNSFMTNISSFQYIIIGRDNIVPNVNIKNNLSNNDFYKMMRESKLLYYHSLEPRHLHYHPLESIIIGVPIIFHQESLLSSYLSKSPGMCQSLHEVQNKIHRILTNDMGLISNIIAEQNEVINRLTQCYNKEIFNQLLEQV